MMFMLIHPSMGIQQEWLYESSVKKWPHSHRAIQRETVNPLGFVYPLCLDCISGMDDHITYVIKYVLTRTFLLYYHGEKWRTYENMM